MLYIYIFFYLLSLYSPCHLTYITFWFSVVLLQLEVLRGQYDNQLDNLRSELEHIRERPPDDDNGEGGTDRLQEQYKQVLLYIMPGRVAQSVTCLATDACLTADPGVASLIPVRSHTFVEIDHEMISTVVLLLSADSFMKGCCQLQVKVCAQITG